MKHTQFVLKARKLQFVPALALRGGSALRSSLRDRSDGFHLGWQHHSAISGFSSDLLMFLFLEDSDIRQ